MFLKSRSRSQLCNIQPFNFLVSGVILLFIINAQEANAAVGDACNATTKPCPGFAEICDTDICVCRYPFYLNGTTCTQRINYGDTCTDGGPQDQCFSNLTCIAGNSISTCGCTDDYQYVQSGNFCKKKNAYGQRCTFVGGYDSLCLVGTCNGSRCVCGTNEYYDHGKDQCISITAASDVTNVTATSTRNSITGVVSLTVRWTPGNYTGPTNYLVTLEEEDRLGSNSYKIVEVQTVTGYNTSEWTKTDVLAYWKYRVFVQAMTDAGNSSVVGPSTARTAANTPGLPQYITVRQDGTGAELALTIKCPEEKERNGTITGYVIRKALLDATGGVIPESEHTVHADSSQTCINTYSARDVGGVTVEQDYIFAVKASNTEFNGSYSQQIFLYVEPKAINTSTGNSTLLVALGVAIPAVFIIIIIIVIVIVVKHRKSKQKESGNERPYNTTNITMSDAHLYYGVTGRAYVLPQNTKPGGQEDIAMVGLHTHQTKLQRKNDAEYLEPIDYYDEIRDIHLRSVSQPSTAAEMVNPLPNSDTRAESD